MKTKKIEGYLEEGEDFNLAGILRLYLCPEQCVKPLKARITVEIKEPRIEVTPTMIRDACSRYKPEYCDIEKYTIEEHLEIELFGDIDEED